MICLRCFVFIFPECTKCALRKIQDEEMEDDAELLLERVEEEMAEEYSEEEDG